MTNIALLLAQHAELKSRIERIVFMGGGMNAGNTTPVAEFNIFVDPEAAEMVLKSGVPLTMAGLNVTHQALVLPQDIERIRQIDNPVAQAVAEMLDFYLPLYSAIRARPGAAMHDPCTIAWLLAPQLFTGVERWGWKPGIHRRHDGGGLFPANRQRGQRGSADRHQPRRLYRSAGRARSALLIPSGALAPSFNFLI